MPLENYVLGKVIGKGSYGEVSLAKHKRDKKQYVIKKIDLHEASEKERTFSEQEVQILAKLRHPNIVSYKESFQSQDGFLHIVMGYCEGGDLYTKLKEYGKNNEYLSERQIVEWFVQIAMALQYMHDRNILHRDLKTQNIFLTKSKIIKIGDLGIARVLESTSDMATTLIGTPYYMSPELFSNKPYNHRSDVWALGCCVYEMTTLKHAFNARDMNALVYKILKGKTPPMPKQYSEELCGIIKSMLAYNPTERPSASKILRHPFVKKHIAIFLEGTKSRKEEKEKRSPSVKSKRSSVTDSGYSGSNESNPEAIATASVVDIDILNEDRKDKYIVKSSESKDEKANRHEKVAKKPSKERRSRPHADKDKVVQPTTEASQDSVTHKNSRQVSDLRQKSPRDQHVSEKEAKDNEKRIPLEEREVQSEKKLVRVKSSDSKDVEPVKRASRKSKKSHGSSPFDKPIAVKEPRPLPPTPSDSPSSQARCLTDPATPNDDVPSQVSIQQQQVGVPNISARQKRRMRLKEEEKMAPAVGRKSSKTHSDSPNIQKSVLKSKSKKQQSLDSVDGPLKSQSEEDSNSELEEISRKPMGKHRPNSPQESGEQSSGDIVDLIGTMQATLNLEPKQRSSRSDTPSPEESLAIDSGLKELSPTLSGRLNGRIERLRRECIRGVGEVMLRKAFEILDTVDDDDLENAFISLLGQKNFELFGDPIRQLKFCEEFAQHSM